MKPWLLAGGIETKSRCRNCEPDHGAYGFTYPDEWYPSEGWNNEWDTRKPQVGERTWSSWGYDVSLYMPLLLPCMNEIIEVMDNPDNPQEFRKKVRVHVFELPDYLFDPLGGLVPESQIYALLEQSTCVKTENNDATGIDRYKPGNSIVSPPTLRGSGSGGCDSCGSAAEDDGRFKVAISLGHGIGGVTELARSPAGQIVFQGDLARGDMLKLDDFAAIGGSGLLDGTLDTGTVTVRDLSSNEPTASATMQTTLGGDGRLSLAEITVTPADGSDATVHRFERVTAAGGMEGVRYERIEGSDAESMTFYNTGTDAPWGPRLAGVFKMVNADGSIESWDVPPEIEPGQGVAPTFVWVPDGSHMNGGYFVGELTERHEYQPADASQPTVVTLRTYGKVGGEYFYQRVLLREEVSQVRGTITLTTEVTRHGYDENPFRSISTANPYGTTNERFGKRVWTLAADGAWSLEMAQEIPTLVDYWLWDEATEDYVQVQELEFVYGDVMEFTPWLDGPAGAGDLGTRAAASAFFEGLMAEARSNGFAVAGCRRTVITPSTAPGIEAAWEEKRVASISGVTHGVEYEYSYAYSVLDLGDNLGIFSLLKRQERWDATESVGTWNASSSGNANVSVTLDHGGVARISSTSSLPGGGTVKDAWQVAVTANGEFHPPSYAAVADHPLWTTTTYDDLGRVITEASLFGTGSSGTTIQTINTTYTGETGSTRTTDDNVVLSSQGDDVVANGQRTSTSTDIDGVETITVTNEATGETISETRLGVTTSYVKAADANGNTTRTVTQTTGGTTRTVSITITDAQGRTVSSTDANGGETTYSYANHGRTVTETLPGGGTRITESYLDGQLKSLTGTAVTAEYHDYTVNDGSDANYESGSITETVYFGTNNGAHWRKTTTNFLGQVLREEEPSPAGANEVLATTHTYNAKGQRVKTSRTGMADMLFEYDDWGRVYRQGYDMDADGELTVASTDILSESNTDYVLEDGQVLERSVRKQYTQDGEDDTLQTTTKRQLLEGSSWQQVTQADGGVLTQTSEISEDATTHEITRTVTAQQVNGAISITQTQTYQNGRLMSETQPGMSQAISYQYTDFGELWKVIHPLSGTTTRTYDEAGRLETVSRNDALAETYAYDEDSRGLVATLTHTDSVTSATTTTTYTYDLQGRVETQGGTAEYPLLYEYDTLGRLWKLHTYRDANSDDVTTWDYISGTNALWKKTDAAERSVTYSYNEAGLLETRTRPRTSTTSIVTTYDYQQSAGGGYIPGRLIRVDYSDSTPDVTHEYDRAGRRKTTTDAAGTHTFTYNAASGGQIDTWTVAGTGVWSGLSVDHDYTHGRRSSRATSLGGIALPTAGYTYQPGTGRMATVTSDGVTATYRYNATTGWNEGVTYSGSGGLSSTRTPDTLGRLDTMSWSAGGNVVSGHDYTLNGMNRRTAAQREDGSQWSYGYNDRGEVTSAAKVDVANIPEPGKQFGFEFDGLGNRTSSTVSSLADDEVMRSTGYAANELNQYETITHPQPGWLVLRGSVNAAASVSIDDEPPTVRAGPLWHYETEVDNSSGAKRRIAEITASRPTGGLNNGPVSTNRKGAVFIPPPSETPTYDWDGNLTSDARWDYTWDGENRLIAAEEKNIPVSVATGTTPPTVTTRQRIECTYDSMNRRLTKKVYEQRTENGQPGTFELKQSLVFLYDQWNMIAEFSSVNESGASVPLALLRTYEWGLDISGTMTGAGGVGGLLIERFHSAPSANSNLPSPGTHAPLYDGNGNITELVNLTTNTLSARYEYGPFGEAIGVDGDAIADANPIRFSTKYLDVETGLLNYTHRYYDPLDGRWRSKDPIQERGGINLYGMVGNDAVNKWDYLGMYGTGMSSLSGSNQGNQNSPSMAEDAIAYFGSVADGLPRKMLHHWFVGDSADFILTENQFHLCVKDVHADLMRSEQFKRDLKELDSNGHFSGTYWSKTDSAVARTLGKYSLIMKVEVVCDAKSNWVATGTIEGDPKGMKYEFDKHNPPRADEHEVTMMRWFQNLTGQGKDYFVYSPVLKFTQEGNANRGLISWSGRAYWE